MQSSNDKPLETQQPGWYDEDIESLNNVKKLIDEALTLITFGAKERDFEAEDKVKSILTSTINELFLLELHFNGDEPLLRHPDIPDPLLGRLADDYEDYHGNF